MTTIACTRDGMAGDGMMSQAGVVHSLNSQKVFRLNNGCIAGFSGDPFAINAVIEALEYEGEPTLKFPSVSNSGLEVLVLYLDGTCHCYNKMGYWIEQSLPAALGIGAPVALGAMYAGADAVRAVEIASILNTCTGGEIRYESLHENHDAIR